MSCATLESAAHRALRDVTSSKYNYSESTLFEIEAIQKYDIWNDKQNFTKDIILEDDIPHIALTQNDVKEHSDLRLEGINEVYENQSHLFVLKSPENYLNTNSYIIPQIHNHYLNKRTSEPILESNTTDFKNKKIVCISDTHNEHSDLNVPDGDILIHAGDFTEYGSIEETVKFNNWLGTLPHKYKIVIAGNHDLIFRGSLGKSLLTNAIYLQDKEINIDGLRIYGTSWLPKLDKGTGAFVLNQPSMLESMWTKIPNDLDILITHTPPAGVLDTLEAGRKMGCVKLTERVKIVKPKLHIFGHIHHSYGAKTDERTTYINAASKCDQGGVHSAMVCNTNAWFWNNLKGQGVWNNSKLLASLLKKRVKL